MDDILLSLSRIVDHLKVVSANDAVLRQRLTELCRSMVALAVAPVAPVAPERHAEPRMEADSPEADLVPPVATIVVSESPRSVPPDSGRISQTVTFSQTEMTVSTNVGPAEASPRPLVVPGKVGIPYLSAEQIAVRERERMEEELESRSTQQYTRASSFHSTATSSVSQSHWHPTSMTEDDLADIEARLALKGEAAFWKETCLRRESEGEDFYSGSQAAEYSEFIARAKEVPNCFLWMLNPDLRRTKDVGDFDFLGHSCEVAATATRVLRMASGSQTRRDVVEQVLNFAAEAQSILWGAVHNVRSNEPDPDQISIYKWIRDVSQERGIYISRYIRKEDKAKPGRWKPLLEQMLLYEKKISQLTNYDKARKKLFQKIRYHASRISQSPGAEHEIDWDAVIRSVGEILETGLPPSNVELRELIMPLEEHFPDQPESMTPGMISVWREIHRYLDSREAEEEKTRPVEEPGAEILEVRELLQGRDVVFIGGLHREHHERKLVEAFDIHELIWIEAHDQSYLTFEPSIRNERVALVILAIRWSRHGFMGAKDLCDKWDKPMVNLPGGYNPRQIAHQILEQSRDRLRSNRGRPPIANGR